MAGISLLSEHQLTNMGWQNNDAGTARTGSSLFSDKKNAGKFESRSAREIKEKSIRESQEMRNLLRDLKKTDEKEQGFDKDLYTSIMKKNAEKEREEEEKAKSKPINYNYKEVSVKIQRAKNSVSAEQACLAAKRKVVELKRKISAKEGDPEELQIALSHAKSMELVARKKKNHLELEEMVERTRRMDENSEKMEETAANIKSDLAALEEDKLSEREDEILKERKDMLGEAAEELKESGAENAEDMLSELNKMLSEFGEDELEDLEEAMEMLENIEILDPHMSEEDLEELKRKHRAAESKAMIKADMDYLKDMIKHIFSKGAAMPGMSTGSGSAAVAAAYSAPQAAPAIAAPVPAAIDIQV